jgi:hypothetical protein
MSTVPAFLCKSRIIGGVRALHRVANVDTTYRLGAECLGARERGLVRVEDLIVVLETVRMVRRGA